MVVKKSDADNPKKQSSYFADLRSDREKRIEKRANNGLSLGPEIDELITELVEIGRISDFISISGGSFDDNGYHIRARQIGVQLNKIGGIELMQAAYYRVAAVLGPVVSRSLEVAWGYIGDWRP